MSFDITNKEQGITALVFSGDGKLLLVGDTLGSVSVYGEMWPLLISLVKGCIITYFVVQTRHQGRPLVCGRGKHIREKYSTSHILQQETLS